LAIHEDLQARIDAMPNFESTAAHETLPGPIRERNGTGPLAQSSYANQPLRRIIRTGCSDRSATVAGKKNELLSQKTIAVKTDVAVDARGIGEASN